MQAVPPQKPSGFWFLFLVCALFPFIWALGFLFPRGDDFDYATRAMFFLDVPGGIYESVKAWLFWSGRYTHHFLVVLLGKAACWPLLSGLVCLTVLGLYALTGYVLARALGGSRLWSALWGMTALFCLLACYQGLPFLYMQTDALSVGLQGGMALLFMALLCRLWRAQPADAVPRSGVRHGALRTRQGVHALWRRIAAPTVWAAPYRRLACVVGVVAAGVYEHAALAVVFSAGSSTLLAWRARHPLARDFMRISACMCLAVALSFLAPGNFVRRVVRHVDASVMWHNLTSLPADWLHSSFGFLSSFWLLAVLALVLLLPRPDKEERENIPSPYPGLCLIAPAGYLLFSFLVALLHCGTDAAIMATPKFAAGLSLYGAFALGCVLYPFVGWIVRRVQSLSLVYDMRLWLILLPAVLILCSGTNWRMTALNASNGAFLDITERLTQRYVWLEAVGRSATADDPAFRFGLLGELARPGSRRRALDPALPAEVVRRLDYGVFPVHMDEALPLSPTAWPNLWVAWRYGLGSVCSAPGDGKAAVEAARQQKGFRLEPAAALEALGIQEARLVTTHGRNVTFAENWLVLRCSAPLPESWRLWRQSPVDMRRLPPLPLQRWWNMLAVERSQARTVLPEWLANSAGVHLHVQPEQWRIRLPEQADIVYAFPLGGASPVADRMPAVYLWGESPEGLMPFGRPQKG